jgi:hypothetical protein
MIKALRRLEVEEMYLNIVKAIYDKLVANIILNGEKLKPFPLKSRMRQGCPLSPLLFSIKGTQIVEETVKISLFADNMILYLKDPQNSTQKLLDTINS